MHIAVCFWGILRSVPHTIRSINQFCLEPLTAAGHTYEIFVHTYSFAGSYSNPRNNERETHLNFTDWQLLQPNYLEIEDQDLFDRTVNYAQYYSQGDPWRNNFTSSMNHIRALNSLYRTAKAVETASQTRNYDAIIYLRPDLTYVNELAVHLLEFIPNTLFLADFHRSCRDGEYNDRMAMGDFQSALIYGKKFEAALGYSQTHKLHSEKFTYDYLQENNVQVSEFPFRFRRTRANGEFHRRDVVSALPAPDEQPPHRAIYSTTWILRCIYSAIEFVTYNQVYVWNHDDNENLYCKPHPYITQKECAAYKRRSMSKTKRKDWKKGYQLTTNLTGSILVEEQQTGNINTNQIVTTKAFKDSQALSFDPRLTDRTDSKKQRQPYGNSSNLRGSIHTFKPGGSAKETLSQHDVARRTTFVKGNNRVSRNSRLNALSAAQVGLFDAETRPSSRHDNLHINPHSNSRKGVRNHQNHPRQSGFGAVISQLTHSVTGTKDAVTTDDDHVNNIAPGPADEHSSIETPNDNEAGAGVQNYNSLPSNSGGSWQGQRSSARNDGKDVDTGAAAFSAALLRVHEEGANSVETGLGFDLVGSAGGFGFGGGGSNGGSKAKKHNRANRYGQFSEGSPGLASTKQNRLRHGTKPLRKQYGELTHYGDVAS